MEWKPKKVEVCSKTGNRYVTFHNRVYGDVKIQVLDDKDYIDYKDIVPVVIEPPDDKRE